MIASGLVRFATVVALCVLSQPGCTGQLVHGPAGGDLAPDDGSVRDAEASVEAAAVDGPPSIPDLPPPDAAADTVPPECTSHAQCDDQDPCTDDSCTAGSCSHAARPKGAACDQGVCTGATGAGACVSCVADAQCSGRTPHCHLPLHTCKTAPLKVMSFNIRVPKPTDGVNIWANRKALAIKVITDHQPDVVGMQEVQAVQRNDFAAALSSYAHFTQAVDQWNNENTVFYRADRLTVVAKGVYWLSPTPFVAFSVGWDAKYSRNCLWMLFRRKSDGQQFYVYNTHFDHVGVTARLESARLIAQKIAARLNKSAPVVLLGDLNAGESSAPIKELKQSLVDTFRVLYPKATDVGTSHGFTGSTSGAKIDYVLVEPETITEAAAIIHDNDGGQYPSDHFPVSARIAFR